MLFPGAGFAPGNLDRGARFALRTAGAGQPAGGRPRDSYLNSTPAVSGS
jgi:hypothetical protein